MLVGQSEVFEHAGASPTRRQDGAGELLVGEPVDGREHVPRLIFERFDQDGLYVICHRSVLLGCTWVGKDAAGVDRPGKVLVGGQESLAGGAQVDPPLGRLGR